jgi:hypothetical protein
VRFHLFSVFLSMHILVTFYLALSSSFLLPDEKTCLISLRWHLTFIHCFNGVSFESVLDASDF